MLNVEDLAAAVDSEPSSSKGDELYICLVLLCEETQQPHDLIMNFRSLCVCVNQNNQTCDVFGTRCVE